MTIGVITMLIDLVVILLGWPVFGDVDAVLYGVLATFVSTIVIDRILYGAGAGTTGDHYHRQRERRQQSGSAGRAGRGVTSLRAVGAYTRTDREVLLCACTKAEAYLVKSAVQEADAKAFFMFVETSEVFGAGIQAKWAIGL